MYKPLQPNYLLSCIFIILLGLTSIKPAFAANQDLYTIPNVKLDQQGKTAALAKQQALEDGQKRALDYLFKRLTMKQDHAKLPVTKDMDMDKFVRSIEINNEKTSATRYLADLTVAFYPQTVRETLKQSEIPFAEVLSQPVVLVPTYQVGTRPILWEESNAWYQAWKKHTLDKGLVPLILPALNDNRIETIDAKQAQSVQTENLAQLAESYKTPKIWIVAAKLTLEGSTPSLNVTSNQITDGKVTNTQTMRFVGSNPESVNELLSTAARTLQQDVQEQWKAETLSLSDTQQTTLVTIPINGLKQWVDVRKKLEDVELIRQMDTASFRTDQVVMEFTYNGNLHQLMLALRQKGLHLQESDNGWTLTEN